MARQVLVVADIRHGKVRNVTFEMLTAARHVAEGGTVGVLLLGQGVAPLAEGMGDAGADRVYVVDDAALQHYVPSAFRKAVLACVAEAKPDVLLLAHSAVGRDLAPMVAARLGAGQVSDVICVDVDTDGICFTRPIYAGKAFTRVRFKDGLVIATVRPNNLPAARTDIG
ncbi:MAG: electron transfer flavoprotein subunit alpha/FixB family protein, partial [Alicyclobacillus sp.]|nr:electron transfer flavoprotein subunit alpha/FixB family protein [Alicyclobacillus sp.]